MIKKIKLFLIRKTKALFLKFNLHILFEPICGALLILVYLTKFSKWRKQHATIPYNDFFSNKFDYNKRYKLYQTIYLKEQLTDSINYFEFGVYTGDSFKWWVSNNNNENSRFNGFDTFTGLPENWNIFKSGDMSTSGNMPVINDTRHTFVAGLFQDTLPTFLRNFDFGNRRNVINMDADLYSSTLYVLGNLYPYLKPGDIIIFDEFGVPTHEFKAFIDFFNSFYLKYEVLAASNNYYQIAIKII